jgi:hypothetical protein
MHLEIFPELWIISGALTQNSRIPGAFEEDVMTEKAT